MEQLTPDILRQLTEIVQGPTYQLNALDRFLADRKPYGDTIADVALITNMQGMENVKEIRTQHGMLRVYHNDYMPTPNTVLFAVIPEDTQHWLEPQLEG